MRNLIKKYQIPNEEYSRSCFVFLSGGRGMAVFFKDVNTMKDKGCEHSPAEEP